MFAFVSGRANDKNYHFVTCAVLLSTPNAAFAVLHCNLVYQVFHTRRVSWKRLPRTIFFSSLVTSTSSSHFDTFTIAPFHIFALSILCKCFEDIYENYYPNLGIKTGGIFYMTGFETYHFMLFTTRLHGIEVHSRGPREQISLLTHSVQSQRCESSS